MSLVNRELEVIRTRAASSARGGTNERCVHVDEPINLHLKWSVTLT